MRVMMPAGLEARACLEERLALPPLHHAKAWPTSSINSSTRLLRKGRQGRRAKGAHKGDAVARCLRDDLMMRAPVVLMKGGKGGGKDATPLPNKRKKAKSLAPFQRAKDSTNSRTPWCKCPKHGKDVHPSSAREGGGKCFEDSVSDASVSCASVIADAAAALSLLLCLLS